ncbi:MAG: Mpo1-like protein [Planctomycetota bacterium]
MKRWLKNWQARHRNRTNFLLHVAGIPATVAAAPLALLGHWLLGAGFLLGGYALQFLGHIVEGNRSGEEQLIRRLLHRR